MKIIGDKMKWLFFLLVVGCQQVDPVIVAPTKKQEDSLYSKLIAYEKDSIYKRLDELREERWKVYDLGDGWTFANTGPINWHYQIEGDSIVWRQDRH